jgi:excinuclease ABC subunit B
MPDFKVISPYQPQGDQPQAIDKLAEGVRAGKKYQNLMGVTGSGKTFTMAHTIARVNKPTLVISHNKTLAAQLYEEFKELFPNNAVGYFVSYYDYYQPEAYIPQRDIYIEKDASRNDDLDRLRLAATSNLVSRNDVLLVASVSCIFGLGSPVDYKKSVLPIRKGVETDRDEMLRKLIDLQYSRNDIDFKRATFRVRGDVVELHPSYEEFAYRIEFFGDEITNIDAINPLTGELLKSEDQIFIYPAVHYVMPEDRVAAAVKNIREELDLQVMKLRGEGKLLEAQRLLARTKYDIEMLLEVGVCPGIENYSRHLDGRQPGEKPYTLIDYFPKDYLILVDESHVTLSQIKAMYNGDRQRKEVLIEHGFRLPSALGQPAIEIRRVRADVEPGGLRLRHAGQDRAGKNRWRSRRAGHSPDRLVDPIVEVQPAMGQVPHLLTSIKEVVERGERVLVTTLTKRLAEDLSAYIQKPASRAATCTARSRRSSASRFFATCGRRLRRSDRHQPAPRRLDLPEVSMVAILDADKAGFLRSETSLIQTIGRAARNVNAKVILYADTVTPAMKKAMDETARRRAAQLEYNEQHGIKPETIKKAIRSGIESEVKARRTVQEAIKPTTPRWTRPSWSSCSKKK